MTEDQNGRVPGRRTFWVTAALISVAVVGSAVNTLPVRGSKPLRVGYNEYSPYTFTDSSGSPAGLAVDVVNEAARRAGQSICWIPVDNADRSLSDGTIDAFPLLAATPERVRRFHFSEYWWQNNFELVSPQKRPVGRPSDTAGRRIGVRMRGSEFNIAEALFPAAKLITKDNVEGLERSLCDAEIDAFFADSRSIERHLVERSLPCGTLKVKIAPVPGGMLPLGMASTRLVRNRADKIYSRIDDLVAEGTLANLASMYMLVTPDNSQHLAQLIRQRRWNLQLKTIAVGLSCLIMLLLFIGLRCHLARRALEQAHKDLDESEQRFHAFMDHLAANAFMKDGAGRMIYVNRADAKMFQLSPQECLGKTDFDLMPRPVAEKLHKNDRVVLDSNSGHHFTESIPDSTGNMHHWLSYKFPFRNRSGEIFLGGVSVEITDMVQIQNALRESESRYRQIVEFAGDIIIRCDARGRVSYVNEAGSRVLGFSASQLRGRKALALIRPDCRKRVLRAFRRAVAQNAMDLYIELAVITAAKSELWLGQNIRVLRLQNAFNGLQAISRDITDRRRMEAELRASEERYRLLYDNGPVAYHEVDRRGVIQRVNHAECDLLGIPAAELIGTYVPDLLAPEERETSRAAIMAKINEQLPLQPFQRTYLRPDGRRVRVEIHENLKRDEAGNVIGIHSVLLDVTQRHLVETLDRDRRELSEMIAQQQPLDRILRGLSRMTTHQDESLCCIPLVLVSEEDRRRLEPISGDQRFESLCDAIRSLDDEAFSFWSLDEFRITHVDISQLRSWASFASLSEQASRMGIQSCWSIPIISSSQNPLGLLLVFSPRKAETTSHERQLLEAGSRLAAIAIEHRYLSELLAFQASHDSLTRLPNRSTFETRLEAAISKASLNNEQLAVIYVDLDRFKQVNDTFGHAVGDELLRQVSARLRRCLRHTDTVARIGGDEFSLLLPGLRDGCEANRVAESILQTFDPPFQIRGVEMSVTCSIGISLYPADGLDAATLQRNSDTAMYRVKKNGRNSFRCYTAEFRPIDDCMIGSEKVA